MDIQKYYYECPECKSEDLNGEDFETDSEETWRSVECNNCGFRWREVYKFSFNEQE